MNKKDKYISLGFMLGIIGCSNMKESLDDSFNEFINWILEKIDEEIE